MITGGKLKSFPNWKVLCLAKWDEFKDRVFEVSGVSSTSVTVLLHDLHSTYSAILLHLTYHANSDMMILLDLLVKSEFI